jgi:hypothetical protein
MDMQVVVRLQASVNDGPCGAGFSVFILHGPGGVNPVPSWTGLYSCSRKAGDATKLDVTRANGVVETIPNGGKLTDWVDGPNGLTVAVTPGRYDVTFEVNAVATADGTVSIRQDSELVLQPH